MILIVEDDRNVSRFFSVNLHMRGHEVVEAANPQAAMEIIRSTPPTLMILDIRLPYKSGWDLLREIEAEGLPYFPVIVASASVFSHDEKQAEFPRISRVLLKPVALSDLLASVSDILEMR